MVARRMKKKKRRDTLDRLNDSDDLNYKPMERDNELISRSLSDRWNTLDFLQYINHP
jgi:hypothetical protein